MAILALVALFYSKVKAQQQPATHSFSIQQCVDYAHNNNVQVKNAIIDYQLQKQTNRGVTAGALPHLSASGNLTDYIDIPTTLVPAEFAGGQPGTFIPLKFGTKYNATGNVSFSQTIFDGQVFVGLQARKASLDYANKALAVTEQTIKANIYKIYYQLSASKTQMSIIDANIALLQKLVSDSKAMHDNGFLEQLDVDRNNVNLANAYTDKAKAQASIDNGYLGLKFLMGMPVSDSLVLSDKITEDDIKTGVLDDSAYQYNNRKDYQYLQVVRQLNQYNVKRYQLAYIPTLALNGVYSKTAQRTKFDIFGKGDWFTTSYLGLTLNIPIFDGFAKQANVATAKLQLQQTENKITDLKNSIDNDASQAKTNFRSAVLTLDAQKSNMQLAQNVYDQTKKKFEIGLASSTDINQAEASLKTAQANYIDAMYSAIIAKVDYNNATGKL